MLGKIFRGNAIPEGTFDGFEKGSYNFLLVCRHWFEVASSTPELWSFWGNNLGDWAKRYPRFQTAPLDLVLRGRRFKGEILANAALRNALRDRAARDTIRRIHLTTEESELLNSIITPLTANCEGLRSSSVESLILRDESVGTTPVDISDFFAHYRFPKLQRLRLWNCAVSSWSLLTSRTSVLTTLDLSLDDPLPTPTRSQLLSILASNPTLQKVALTGRAVSGYHSGSSSLRVPLHHLKELKLSGGLRNIIGLLDQLDHAKNANLRLNLCECVVGDISQTLLPCLQNYLQHRDKPRNGLGLYVSRQGGNEIIFHMGDVGEIHPSAPESERMVSFMGIVVCVDQSPFGNLLEKAIFDLITGTPREEIVYLKTHRSPVMEGIYSKLPNLKALYSDTIPLSAVLPKGKGILPSLQHIFFERVVADGGDWGPLVAFLSRRASSGNRLASLTIVRSSFMRTEVVENIRRVVREFRTGHLTPL